jgi:hypothetical protein
VTGTAVILVEGASDAAAVAAAARRFGRDLEAEGVSVVPLGGASAYGDALHDLFATQGFAGPVAGLYDEAEAGDVRRGLARAGLGIDLSSTEMAALGFHVCVADLEDEMIRALGSEAVERVVSREDELRSFRTMQRQPAWLGRPVEEQLRRFIGAKSGRKARYGRLLIEAVEMDRIPEPLRRVFDHV